MSGIIEQQYIMDISSRLDLFTTIVPSRIYNFSDKICQCGGSSKSDYKKRGYFFYSSKDDIFMYKCHNCGQAFSFQTFLKEYFETEYKELRKRIFKESGIVHRKLEEKKVDYSADDIFSDEYQEQLDAIFNTAQEAHIFVPLSDLPESHKAVEYINSRKIPKSSFDRIFYSDNYGDFVNSVIPSEIIGDRKIPRDPRVILQFLTVKGDLMGLQGRCLYNDSELRYSITKLSEVYPKMFGLETVDINSNCDIIVTEGAFDSLFIKDSIALNGGDIASLLNIAEHEGIDPSRFIIVLDNEPRSKDTIKRMNKVLKSKLRMVIWDKIESSYKDINDMILNDVFTADTLLDYIKNNNYKGMTAKLKLSKWSKV